MCGPVCLEGVKNSVASCKFTCFYLVKASIVLWPGRSLAFLSGYNLSLCCRWEREGRCSLAADLVVNPTRSFDVEGFLLVRIRWLCASVKALLPCRWHKSQQQGLLVKMCRIVPFFIACLLCRNNMGYWWIRRIVLVLFFHGALRPRKP